MKLLLIKSKMLKSGHLFKLGDGPINYNWNQRYFVLDGNYKVIMSAVRAKSRVDVLRVRVRHVAERDLFPCSSPGE